MAKRPKLKKRQSKKPHRRNSLPAIATLSAGTSQRRAIPIPRGRRPSMAALTDRARERRSAKYCGRLPAVSDFPFPLGAAPRMRHPASSGNYIVGHGGPPLTPRPARYPAGQRAWGSSGSSPRRHFVERERKTRRAIAAGERHTDESFRAD